MSLATPERQNLTMRMQVRRFTRLTNAFSKKWENHLHMVALYSLVQFREAAQAHRMSPAGAAGRSDKLWSVGDIANLVERRRRFQRSAMTINPVRLRFQTDALPP